MTTRIWTKQQLSQVANMAVKGGYLIDAERETFKVITPDRKHTVLTALKGPGGKWIARYDDTVFGSSK